MAIKKPKSLGKKNNHILKNVIDTKDKSLSEIRKLWEQCVENGSPENLLKTYFTKYFELLVFSLSSSVDISDDQLYGYFLLNCSRKIDTSCTKPVDSHITYQKMEVIFNPILLRKYTNRQIKNFVILELLHIMNLHELRKSEYINVDNIIYHVSCCLTVSHIMREHFMLPNLITCKMMKEKFNIDLDENQKLDYYIKKLNDNKDVKDFFNNSHNQIQNGLNNLNHNNSGSGNSSGQNQGNSQSSSGSGNSNNQSQGNSQSSSGSGNSNGQNQGSNQQASSSQNKPQSREDLLNQLDSLADNSQGFSDNWDSNPSKSLQNNMKEKMSNLIETTMKSTGINPGHLTELIKALRQKPIINWQKQLKHMKGSVKVPYKKTLLRRPRRCPDRYDIKGRISDRRVKVLVAIDTSGSMGKKELEFIFNEIFSILSTVKFELTVIECDAEINYIYEAKSIKDINFKIHGRGGTSFIPVFKWLKNDCKTSKYPDLIIYFTDGYGDRTIPENLRPKAGTQLMWVLTGTRDQLSVQNPFTKNIKQLNIYNNN